jgi:serine phosphatase RsbU (regulator of sigma subunit)
METGVPRGSPVPKPSSIPASELSIAAEIQSYMLPKRTPIIEGYDLTAYYQPCAYVGGDYYDFIELDADYLGIVVADVAGKGFPGAMVMVQTRTLLRAEAKHTLSPRDVLIRMNRGLAGEIPRGMFVTMLYVLLNIPRSELTVCSAGHNAMLYWRQRERKPAFVNTKGLALGIDRGPVFEKTVAEAKIRFEPGDRFFMYTDGLTETMNPSGEQYGTERLAARFQDFGTMDCSGFMTSLLVNLNGFRAGAPPGDDITFVAVRRLPSAVRRAPPQMVSGEKFVACPFCEAVNVRSAARCAVCREPLAPKQRIRLAVAKDEVECPCGHIMKRRRDLSACPRCSRPVKPQA